MKNTIFYINFLFLERNKKKKSQFDSRKILKFILFI